MTRRHIIYREVIHCANSRALHAYHGSDADSYRLPCHGRSKDRDSQHRNFRDMVGTSTSSTMRSMRVECIIFYVDPKSVGSLNLLEKERVRFPITDEHSSLAVFTKKFAEFAGIKAEAEKRGLGSCVELKLCRLEKGKDGSKAFAINTQEQWDEERPLHQGPITQSVQLTYFRTTAFSQVRLFLDTPFPRISFQKPIRSGA